MTIIETIFKNKLKIRETLIELKLWRVFALLLKQIAKLEDIIDYRDYGHSSPEVVEELKDLIEGKVVCDLGCRKGYLMQDFQKYAKRVIGIDFNDSFCRICRRKGLEVIKGDFTTMELPEADVYYVWLKDEVVKDVLDNLRKGGKKGKFVIGHKGQKSEIINI